MFDLKIECDECAACCCDTIPIITDRDIRRITKETGKRPLDFVKLYSERKVEIGPERGSGFVNMAHGKRIMGLKQKNEQCIFLSRDKRCTIYEVRPFVCRTYPFDIKLDQNGKITAIGFHEKASHGKDICTAVARVVAVDRYLVEDTMQEDREDRSYWRKCNKWNRIPEQQRTLGDFLNFLGL
jgi:hypothetical protein